MTHPIEDTALLEHHDWGYLIEAPDEAIAIATHNFRFVERELDRIWAKKKKKRKPVPVETGKKKKGQR